ncbi:MAG: hypothetical protein ACI4TP_03945, partial [Anaerotignum sp.]
QKVYVQGKNSVRYDISEVYGRAEVEKGGSVKLGEKTYVARSEEVDAFYKYALYLSSSETMDATTFTFTVDSIPTYDETNGYGTSLYEPKISVLYGQYELPKNETIYADSKGYMPITHTNNNPVIVTGSDYESSIYIELPNGETVNAGGKTYLSKAAEGTTKLMAQSWKNEDNSVEEAVAIMDGIVELQDGESIYAMGNDSPYNVTAIAPNAPVLLHETSQKCYEVWRGETYYWLEDFSFFTDAAPGQGLQMENAKMVNNNGVTRIEDYGNYDMDLYGLTASIPVGNTITVITSDGKTRTVRNTTGDRTAKVVAPMDGSMPCLMENKVDLQKGDAVACYTNDDDKYVFENMAEPSAIVDKTSNLTFTIPAKGLVKAGEIAVGNENAEITFSMDSDGCVVTSRTVADGETITVNGVRYTGINGGSSLTAKQDGTVTFDAGKMKMSINPETCKDPDFVFDFDKVPADTPVEVGNYTYEPNQTGTTLKGNADGNPIVVLEDANDTVDVYLTKEPAKKETFKAANDDSRFFMAADADVTNVTLVDNEKSANSGLTFTGKTPYTVDQVKYTGEEGKSYSVYFGTEKDMLELNEDGKVEVAFSSDQKDISANTDAKVGSDTLPAGAKIPATRRATVVFTKDADGLEITGGRRTTVGVTKDEAGNVTEATVRYKKPSDDDTAAVPGTPAETDKGNTETGSTETGNTETGNTETETIETPSGITVEVEKTENDAAEAKITVPEGAVDRDSSSAGNGDKAMVAIPVGDGNVLLQV